MSVAMYHIHIKTDRVEEVKAVLVRWLEDQHGRKPVILSNQDSTLPFFDHDIPTQFALCHLYEEWVTVLHDSYEQLMELTSTLSSRFNTLVIHTLGQSTVDTYHLNIFQEGQLLRKFDVGEGYDGIEQYGEPLSFEKDPVNHSVVLAEEDPNSFDYQDMQEYCLYFGLDILVDPSEKDGFWEVIQIQREPAPVHKTSLLQKIFLRRRK
ncbi:hypothetical protein CN378_04715 [Bacillus sp. AFS015802]|uniref:hypothetical protein n=1 Tax=Bacillus sp. AFS015802 TaxID=2033486 RepID=UPI000BF9D6C9|nr:hypothetical protein [Bacillus sp. AFS015802]PFA69182.1 hypothetical protein CN378_04715 [Bacillus sp. AFS015802]